jgi:hypothetical protein
MTVTTEATHVLAIETADTDGRSTALIFKKYRDTVDVWERFPSDQWRSLASIDRDRMTQWLAQPNEPLFVDDLIFSIDYAIDPQGQLTISVRRVTTWTLSFTDERRLNRYL